MNSKFNPEATGPLDDVRDTISRRQALARLGLSAAAVYAAPALLPLNRAAAASHDELSDTSEPTVASEPSVETAELSDTSVASVASGPSDDDGLQVDPISIRLLKLLGFAN